MNKTAGNKVFTKASPGAVNLLEIMVGLQWEQTLRTRESMLCSTK